MISGSSLMSSFNFISKYAKYDPELRRRETFEEAVDRMVDMHIEKYLIHPNNSLWGHGASPRMWKVRNEIEAAFELVKEKRLLASQRTLQFGGPGILKHNFRNYNCSTTYVDRLRVFAEIEYLLLCGCGVGFSVQKHHVAKLPRLLDASLDGLSVEDIVFVVSDTIEGWANAFNALISSYHMDNEHTNINYIFDFSHIRPQGAPLSTGGKAPGPEPLRHALAMVRKVIEKAWSEGKARLSPLDCHDIICHMSDSVLAGGVRRSALISLFSPDDEEMMNAKTGDWYVREPQRARANNSAILLREKTSKELFLRLFESTKQFGEPGFIFANTLESTFNPCSEINLYPLLIRDQKGDICDSYTIDMLNNQQKYKDLGYTYESGVAVCNLCEINGAVIKDRNDFEEVIRAAAIIGTLQAGYTEPGYLTQVSKDIVEREALLGISITGMMDNPDICFEVNREWADILGIRPAARVTCVKISAI
jgi:ribonucleoside-diphosphate reductase alpha chain